MSRWEYQAKSSKRGVSKINTKNSASTKCISSSFSINPSTTTRNLLSNFKTTPCPNESRGRCDHRICHHYHSSRQDLRRNPFEEYYELDEIKTEVERMYHPVKFRTTVCNKAHSCPIYLAGGLCAKAHSEMELRNEEDALSEYRMFLQSKFKVSTLFDFFPKQRKPAGSALFKSTKSSTTTLRSWSTSNKTQSLNDNSNLTTKRIVFDKQSIEWFMIKSSRQFLTHLHNIAYEEGLCKIRLQLNCWETDSNPIIQLNGYDVSAAHNKIETLLEKPPDGYFISKEDNCISERARDKLVSNKDVLIPKKFKDIMHVTIRSDENLSVKLCATIEKNNADSCQDAMDSVFDKIRFWARQDNLDDFRDCCCCLTERNLDEGIECKSCLNFICKVDKCFDSFIKSIIPEIQGNSGKVHCPMCQVALNVQELAKHLNPDTWEKLHKAIVDNEVKSEYDKLQVDFDLRLDEKVNELFATYQTVENVMKLKAESNAAKARNEALNLKCPHCATVYLDFEGCMALKCSTCNEIICGYFHTKLKTSAGAHEHVRECLMNETQNGSYYAQKEEIKLAQRRYRTREIKRFLRKFKKEEQNAIIIELKSDLQDLDINPASLFEFGNELHGL